MGKRTQILLTAEKILAERGLYGLSMKYLADTAGVAAGTIYRYFDSKEVLLAELHQYVRTESATVIFTGWSGEQSCHQKYNLLWRNTFNAVLNNPQRLTVIEMLDHIPNECREKLNIFDDDVFHSMLVFYQQGIDDKVFKNWPIPVLITLSFDSAINLAKKVLHNRLETNEQLIQQVSEASWATITI